MAKGIERLLDGDDRTFFKVWLAWVVVCAVVGFGFLGLIVWAIIKIVGAIA